MDCKVSVSASNCSSVSAIVADEVHGTFIYLFAVGTAGIKTRPIPLILSCKVHTPSTVGTLDQSREYLCRTVFPLPAAAGDLLLYLVKHVLADDGFVSPLDADPF